MCLKYSGSPIVPIILRRQKDPCLEDSCLTIVSILANAGQIEKTVFEHHRAQMPKITNSDTIGFQPY
jgi:hypothetical protein